MQGKFFTKPKNLIVLPTPQPKVQSQTTLRPVQDDERNPLGHSPQNNQMQQAQNPQPTAMLNHLEKLLEQVKILKMDQIQTPAQKPTEKLFNKTKNLEFSRNESVAANQLLASDEILSDPKEEDVSELGHDGDTIYDSMSNYQRTSRDGFWGVVGKGFSKLVVVPFKGLEYIMDGGAKSNKIFMKKMMLKNTGNNSKKYREQSQLQVENDWRSVLKRIGFKIQYILMPMIVLFSSSLSLLNLIMWSYYRRGYMQSEDTLNYLISTDALLFICFTIEFFFNIIVSQDLDEIFDFENVLLIIYNFELMWIVSGNPYNTVTLFLHSLRALRTTKLRYISKLFSYYVERYIQRMKNDDLVVEENHFDEESEMNRFILNEMAGFAGGILFESSLLLALDSSLGYNAFEPFTPQNSDGMKFHYISSAYYVVASFSTVGYGDIFPIRREARLAVCLMIIVNMTIFTNLIGRLVEHIFMISPYRQNYDFKDHIVIIGNMQDEGILNFLEEIVENDNVERQMRVIDSFGIGIKCIVVMEKEPKPSLLMLASFIQERYDNEIVFLMDDILSCESKCRKKCNLLEAKILFAFSHEQGDSQATYLIDQQLAIVAKLIKEDFQHLHVVLVLNSVFKKQIEDDNFYMDIDVVSQREINEVLLAQTLESPGLASTLQNLFTMKSKVVSEQVSQIAAEDDYLKSYIENSQSEVYKVQLPDFFVGLPFKKVAQILYMMNLNMEFSNLNYETFYQQVSFKGREPMTLIAIETINDDNFASMHDSLDSKQSDLDDLPHHHHPNPVVQHADSHASLSRSQQQENAPLQFPTIPLHFKKSGDSPSRFQNILKRVTTLRLQGLKTPHPKPKGASQDASISFQKKVYPTQLLLNPQNYKIKKNDFAYVICNNGLMATHIKDLKNMEHPDYKEAIKNLEIVYKTVGNPQLRGETIEALFDLSQEGSMNSLQMDSVLSKRDKMSRNYVNLHEKEKAPRHFERHIIIVSKLDRFLGILKVISKLTNRPVILFTQDDLDLQIWSDICNEFNEIYYFQGNFVSLAHLEELQIPNAKSVLITSGLIKDAEYPDAFGICLAKILQHQFNYSAYLIELEDEERLHNIASSIQLKKISFPNYIHRPFIQGGVHLKAMSASVLARLVFNPSWLRLFQQLILPKNNSKIAQNHQVRCLHLTEVACEAFQFFGILQFALMEMKPSVIAINLLKHKIQSKFGPHKPDNFFDEQTYRYQAEIYQRDSGKSDQQQNQSEDLQFRSCLLSQMKKQLGDRYVMTNPQFYTPLEKDDMLVVIGNINLRIEDMAKLSLPSLGDPRIMTEVVSPKVSIEPVEVKLKYADPELRIDLKKDITEELKRRINQVGSLKHLLPK